MEGLTAFLAGPAAGHSLDYDLVGDLKGDRAVDVDARGLQSLGLGDGAGHTVEDIPVDAVGLSKALVYDADDNIVGNEPAAVHICLSLKPDGSAVFHGRPKDVSGGNGGDREHFAQDLCLSTFTCAGGA